MLGWIRSWRRRRVRAEPFPEHWRPILAERVPYFSQLPDALRPKVQGDLMVFEREKSFVGAGGFEVTEEVRVVIAAAAVRLVAELDIAAFDRMREIVVYPAAYRHPGSDTVVLGEVSPWHTVVLSWEDVLAGLANPRDGRDTATHEFAHVLDRASGAFNGTPNLRARADYAPWGSVLSAYFLRLRRNAGKRKTLLRSYGATNEAEFFAVATEMFFERPGVLRRKAPDLYAELGRFYGTTLSEPPPAADTAAEHVPAPSSDTAADHAPPTSSDTAADHAPPTSSDTAADHVPAASSDSAGGDTPGP